MRKSCARLAKRPQQIIANARDAADATIARSREEAGKQAEEYLARAESTLRAETEQARMQLRQEVADLAVNAATKIVRKELDPASQARLIEETLARPALPVRMAALRARATLKGDCR